MVWLVPSPPLHVVNDSPFWQRLSYSPQWRSCLGLSCAVRSCSQGRTHPSGAPKHGAPRPGASQASRVCRPSPAWLGMSITVSFHPQDVKKDRERNHQNPGSRRESTPTLSLTSRPCRKTSRRPQTRTPRGRAGAHMCPVGTACRCRVATPCPAACRCCCQPTAAPCCPPRLPSPQVGGPEAAPRPPSLRGPRRVCLCPCAISSRAAGSLLSGCPAGALVHGTRECMLASGRTRRLLEEQPHDRRVQRD